MEVQENISLRELNSFGIDVKAKFYTKAESVASIEQALQNKIHSDIFILSGGSNVLLTDDIDAHVVHICNKGVKVVAETNTHTKIEVAAGENWHDLVLWALDHNLGGIENLALIPGCVGSAPIQNIGAYGVEIKDSFIQCQALDIKTLEKITLSNENCEFGYRSSIFKTTAKGKYVIYNIQLQLTKSPHPIKITYGDIENTLINQTTVKEKNGEYTISEIAKAIISIRKNKLPDPKLLGNSGSFFKNPVIDKALFEKFIKEWPQAPFYKVENNSFKIPAGWLIENAGLKGFKQGAVGVHEKQALVLVNYGGAKGHEVLSLAKKVMTEVLEKFSISLEPEVNIIPQIKF